MSGVTENVLCDRNALPERLKRDRAINIKKRMEGVQYTGISLKNGLCQRAERQLGPPCTSKYCEQRRNRYCSHFTANVRKSIFNVFWQMTWEQKKLYVIGLVDPVSKKRISSENSSRTQSLQYFLKQDTQRLQVCRQMFLSTLDLKEKMVRTWMKGSCIHGAQMNPDDCRILREHSKRESPIGQKNLNFRKDLESFLGKLPKMESHYCRKTTTKLYFEADFTSLAEVYKLYSNEFATNGKHALSYNYFLKVIKDLNYSVFHPKKDECDFCLSYKSKNVSDEEYQLHRQEIDKMREEKRNDIENRNVVLSNAFLSLCVEKKITIEQKYLIRGHTQMECDATHSLIERKIKNKQINLPSQFIQLIGEARKSSPLQAHKLNYDYFLNYENIPKRFATIRPGKKAGDPTVNMLRALAYDPSEEMYYKINIRDEYQPLPITSHSKKFCEFVPSPLYTQKLKISKKKWDHLQDLKKLLPLDCHPYYDNLPYAM